MKALATYFLSYFNYCDNSGEGSDGDAAPFKGGFYSNTLSKIIGHARERKVLVVAVVEVVEETAGLCAIIWSLSQPPRSKSCSRGCP
eukprot:scaffold41222_cov139-Skeletonema_marinoi.AAC.5